MMSPDSVDKTTNEYRKLIANNERFSVLTSLGVVQAAAVVGDPGLDQWVRWYRGLHRL